ncbi:MAG TPA: hypothetical protein VJO99_16250 [Burkholderiaceae bacterium]|nr:hypothetical protein [Burkholderiaceae bacterium]
MSHDPTNQLPTDPDWLRKIEEHAEAAAKDLGCMVVMMSVQENGKLCTTVAGVPKSGELAEMAKDPASLLASIALISHQQDQRRAGGEN